MQWLFREKRDKMKKRGKIHFSPLLVKKHRFGKD
jgi:hypothetical protein